MSRIFLVLSPSGNNSVPNSNTWIRNLYEPLLDLNHNVFLFRIDFFEKQFQISRGSKIFKTIFSETIYKTFLNENEKEPFQYFISYLENNDIEVDIINRVKSKGVLTLNFSCNNTHQFYLVDKISTAFDYNLHSEKEAGKKFLQIGANPVWFQMAANPKYYFPKFMKRTIDVSFVGSKYAKRGWYVYHLLENSIDVHTYGPGWQRRTNMQTIRAVRNELRRTSKILHSIFTHNLSKRNKLTGEIADSDFNNILWQKYYSHFHLPISDDYMINVFNQSKINLGFLEVFNNYDKTNFSLQHLHLREFEVPMCGGLYLTNYSDELAEHYEPDIEVLVFRNQYELLDKTRYYLTHEDEAEKVRRAAYSRAIKCHTYQQRFKDLFEKLAYA